MENITLDNIAGYETEKAEAKKIINFLKKYDMYTKEGITLTKGLLLSGQPGVGKTLFAKAIAGEAKVNFVEFHNTDFNSIQNLKDYFKKAKELKPSILFIDEIDELLPARYDSTDEEKKVLQTFLTELDGVSSSEGIIVIATSMYQDLLPDSLTRSGRLEKCIHLERPNFEAREKIFKYYLDKHKVFKNINPSVLAKKTLGFTGANIKQLVNEALLEMNSRGEEASLSIFEEYIPVITFKDIKKVNEKETLKTVIPHEIGHFICSYVLKGESAVITVAKFAQNLGYTRIVSKEKNRLFSEKDIMNELVINLGGMAAEKVILGEATLGSSSDIEQCIKLIANAFKSGIYGFEYRALEYPASYGPDENIIPEKTKELLDDKKNELLNSALSKAEEIIKDNIYIYDLLKDKLYEKDTLTSEEIDYILAEYNKENTLN